ncbi:uroporphyrinogen-III synthase [Acetobacter sacchari]|uniref:Uroporphyrinogen-III synthase n=1 Tax=Acetobacter sacchari TaxID=2661687 RepID=A0ABS3LTK1_9PROT|nr:uroporphyrinogen-III synthase [Acetobacter sacchari]MBO1359241.1 uroporphyrinogen-III synthase [Acetobacter sacchari]
MNDGRDRDRAPKQATARRVDHRGVLVTRPEPGLSETMELLRERGWRPYAAPALAIAPRCVKPQQGVAAAILTSGQAVDALSATLPASTQVFTVGDATAQTVERAGFKTTISANGNASDLFRLVAATLTPEEGPLLLLSGEAQGLPLARALRAAGYTVRRRVAYAAVAVKGLPASVADALHRGKIDVVMAYSARSAAATIRALELAEIRVSDLTGVAISENTAAIMRAGGFRTVAVAAHPDAESMLNALETVLHKEQPAAGGA